MWYASSFELGTEKEIQGMQRSKERRNDINGVSPHLNQRDEINVKVVCPCVTVPLRRCIDLTCDNRVSFELQLGRGER